MIPHSASGGNSAIEDAAVLSECLSFAFDHNSPIGRGTELYELLRKPRVHRMQAASREGYQFLGYEESFQQTRDALLTETTKAGEAELDLSEEERRAKKPPPGDMNAPFPSPAYLQWLYGADVIKEAKSHLANLEEGTA